MTHFLARNWWLVFPAWLAAACIAGPLIGKRLKRNSPPPVPGLPEDGEPLTPWEKGKLINILIDTRHCPVSEPVYKREGKS